MLTGKGKRDEKKTREVTGLDAAASEADIGSAGNGAAPFGADLTGGRADFEDEPSGRDIATDNVEKHEDAGDEEDEDEREISARPSEKPDTDLSKLP
jgi:hypothetical protein